jgi:hypothetical protein
MEIRVLFLKPFPASNLARSGAGQDRPGQIAVQSLEGVNHGQSRRTSSGKEKAEEKGNEITEQASKTDNRIQTCLGASATANRWGNIVGEELVTGFAAESFDATARSAGARQTTRDGGL